MTDIAFYHLQRSPLAAVLPNLLQRTLEAGKRGLVVTGSDERCEDLNMLLWTQNPNGWLPHGSARDGAPEAQPVWLTNVDENPNGAEFVFLTDGAKVADLGQFERGFDLFDGNDADAVEAARGRWRALKDSGHTLTYWQQNEAGKWQEKAGT